MSKFFKALEQAEQERIFRERASALKTERAAPVIPERREQEGKRGTDLPETLPAGVDDHLVSLLAPTSFEAEQYRALRHLIEEAHRTANVSFFGVTSATVRDGKTMTAINLAGALAQAEDTRVLLVDGDLRQPSIAEYLGFGSSSRPGLADAILDPGVALEEVVKRRPPFRFSVLSAGRPAVLPYELLKSPRLAALLEEARRSYDYVVLDSPPLVPVPDGRVLGNWVDALLIVVAAHRTPRKLLEEALKLVDPAKVMGLVFNGDERPLSRYDKYHYGYRTG